MWGNEGVILSSLVLLVLMLWGNKSFLYLLIVIELLVMITIFSSFLKGGLISSENEVLILLVAAVEASLGLTILVAVSGMEAQPTPPGVWEGF